MSSARDVPVHGVLITYRRPDCVSNMLEALARQSVRLRSIVVVDNAAQAEVGAIVAAASHLPTRIEYVAAPENLGPAGGLYLGMSRVLEYAGLEDWVVGLDDDDPPRLDDGIERLFAFATDISRKGQVGGVGLGGARLDRRTGRLVRPGDDELHGAVPVDYIGGNRLPMYAARALRTAGLPEPGLFFGFDDLEIGLKLGRAGFPLFSAGDLHRLFRESVNRMALDVAPARNLSTEATWRRYYSLRNLVWLLNREGARRAAWRVSIERGLLKPMVNLPRSPRIALTHLSINLRAVRDGFAGRLGRTVEPETKKVDAPKRKPHVARSDAR